MSCQRGTFLNMSIIIIDYGSQYTTLIARRIRSDCSVWCEIKTPAWLNRAPEAIDEELNAANIAGIVLSGGPNSTISDNSSAGERAVILDPKTPVLGICYGAQLIATVLGGKVGRGAKGEYGNTEITWSEGNRKEIVWMSHEDVVIDAGKESVVTSMSPAGIASFVNERHNCFALQFHPEVTHTENGWQLLVDFVNGMCKCGATWTDKEMLQKCNEIIYETVSAHDHVVLGLSGGVDSMVTATLLQRAKLQEDPLITETRRALLNSTNSFKNILDRMGLTDDLEKAAEGSRISLTCILVDMGLMREGEVEEVQQCCRQQSIDLRVVDLSEQCLSALRGVTDPEQKRKIIGELFTVAFQGAVTSSGRRPTILAQGTIYPDVVESGASAGKSAVIKSHHNVGGLPKDLGLKVLEPLRWLFKDEVRDLGRQLGLPENIIGRHPFPGPGLAIRVVGEITREKLYTLKRVDAIWMRAIRDAGLYYGMSQAYAAILDSKAVGVVGDQRRYGWIVSLRAVCTEDFMTADVFPADVKWLQSVSTEIVNQCSAVARVMYDITSKPPGTIELE